MRSRMDFSLISRVLVLAIERQIQQALVSFAVR